MYLCISLFFHSFFVYFKFTAEQRSQNLSQP